MTHILLWSVSVTALSFII